MRDYESNTPVYLRFFVSIAVVLGVAYWFYGKDLTSKLGLDTTPRNRVL